MTRTASTSPVRDLGFAGYSVGQRDEALLLDYLALYASGAPFKERIAHPSSDMSLKQLDAAHAGLIARGLAVYDAVGDLDITPAGLAAHAASQNSLADIARKIAEARG